MSKTKYIFIFLFSLMLINIGILFINKSDFFINTLISLSAITFALYYILAWIKTIKSIKNDTNKKNILPSILQIPSNITRLLFVGRMKYIGLSDEEKRELEKLGLLRFIAFFK